MNSILQAKSVVVILLLSTCYRAQENYIEQSTDAVSLKIENLKREGEEYLRKVMSKFLSD